MAPPPRDERRTNARSTAAPAASAERRATPILLRDPERLHRIIDRMLTSAEGPPDALDAVARSAAEVFEPLRSELGLASIAVYAEEGDTLRLRREVGGGDGKRRDAVPVPVARHLLAATRRAHVFPDPTAVAAPPALGMAPAAPTAVRVVEAASGRHLLVATLDGATSQAAAEFVLGVVGTVLAARALRERWRHSLDEAAEIQRELLPAAIPPVPGYQVAARCVPAELVGGDFYDVLPLGHGATGVAVGDAVGHGLAAALVARDVAVGLRVAFDRRRPAAGVLARLNRVMRAGLPGRAFATLAWAELRPDGRFEYVSAGHQPALRVRPGASTLLRRTGPVLGPFEQVAYRATRSRLARGELLVLYTDGIVERRNPRGDLFTETRLAEIVQTHATEPVEQIIDRVFGQAAGFGEGAPWADDATLVIVRRDSRAAPPGPGGRGHRSSSASATASGASGPPSPRD